MIGVCFRCGTIVRMERLRCEDCPMCPKGKSYDTLVRINERERSWLADQSVAIRASYATRQRNHR